MQIRFIKRSNTGKMYDYGVNETINKLPLLKICAMKDDSLVGIVSPEDLSKIDIGTSDDINLRKFSQAIYSVKEDNNPVLLFYQLK